MNAETLRAYGVRDLEDVQQNLDKSITKAVYRSSADLQRLRGLCAEDGTVDYECIVTNKRGNAASLLVHTEVITTLEGKRAVYTTFLDVSENESVKSEKRILNTLYQDYIAFFYLGFNQGTISILKSDKSTVLFADDGKSTVDFYCYQEQLEKRFALDIYPDAAHDFTDTLSPAHLRQCLLQNQRLSYRFSILQQHHYEITVSRTEGNDSTAVMGFRLIDDIIAQEEQKKA